MIKNHASTALSISANSDKTISNITEQNRIFILIQGYLNAIKILTDIKKSETETETETKNEIKNETKNETKNEPYKKFFKIKNDENKFKQCIQEFVNYFNKNKNPILNFKSPRKMFNGDQKKDIKKTFKLLKEGNFNIMYEKIFNAVTEGKIPYLGIIINKIKHLCKVNKKIDNTNSNFNHSMEGAFTQIRTELLGNLQKYSEYFV